MTANLAASVTPYPGDHLKATSQRVTYILVTGKPHHYPLYTEAFRDRENIAHATGVKPKLIRSLNVSREEVEAFEVALDSIGLLRKCERFLFALKETPGATKLSMEIRKHIDRAIPRVGAKAHGDVEQ